MPAFMVNFGLTLGLTRLLNPPQNPPLKTQKRKLLNRNFLIYSGATKNRTRDTRIFSPLLYQLSYGTNMFLTGAKVGIYFEPPNII